MSIETAQVFHSNLQEERPRMKTARRELWWRENKQALCISCMIAAQHEMINDLRKGRSGWREELWGKAAKDKSIHTQSAALCFVLPGNRERPTFVFSSVSRNLFLVWWAHRRLFLGSHALSRAPKEIMKNIAICLRIERAVVFLFTFGERNNFYEFRIADEFSSPGGPWKRSRVKASWKDHLGRGLWALFIDDHHLLPLNADADGVN